MLDPMDLIDPELRPIPPQPGCEPSMQIYQDHRRVRNEKTHALYIIFAGEYYIRKFPEYTMF